MCRRVRLFFPGSGVRRRVGVMRVGRNWLQVRLFRCQRHRDAEEDDWTVMRTCQYCCLGRWGEGDWGEETRVGGGRCGYG